jgi:hypothetical protein
MVGQETAKDPRLGVIVSIRGSVVDIRFDEHLPPIYPALLTRPKKQVVIEVLARQDAHHGRRARAEAHPDPCAFSRSAQDAPGIEGFDELLDVRALARPSIGS